MKSAKFLFAGLAVAGAVLTTPAADSARHAFMLRVEKEGIQACRSEGLASPDSAIRKYALACSFAADPAGTLAFVEKAAADPASEVRALAAKLLAYEVNDSRRAILEKLSTSDPDQQVRLAATAALWPFSRKNVLLKDDPSWDYLVKKVGSFEFPANGWKYAVDPGRNGHLHGYFAIAADDVKWEAKAPGTTEKAGVHWYRTNFTPQPPAKFNSFEIVLPAVSGKCFVWLNGIYLGDRLTEKSGEVRLNAAKELLPNRENTLVVRVESAQACGMTAPVRGEWME